MQFATTKAINKTPVINYTGNLPGQNNGYFIFSTNTTRFVTYQGGSIRIRCDNATNRTTVTPATTFNNNPNRVHITNTTTTTTANGVTTTTTTSRLYVEASRWGKFKRGDSLTLIYYYYDKGTTKAMNVTFKTGTATTKTGKAATRPLVMSYL
jgi:hypothetical protein